MYAETSYAGTPLFGERNPTPTHFHHIAAWQDRQRCVSIKSQAAQLRKAA